MRTPKWRKVQTPWSLLPNVISHRGCRKGAGTHPGVCAGVWASSLSDDKSLTQRSGGLSWEQWGGPGKGKKLTGFSKAPCQFCAQCLHSPGQVNSVMPGPCQSQGDTERWPGWGQGHREKRHWKRVGWHKAGKVEAKSPSPLWRRAPLNAQIRTLVLDEILVFLCSECRYSWSYILPEPHCPSRTGFLLLWGWVQNQWGAQGLSELTPRSWQGALII